MANEKSSLDKDTPQTSVRFRRLRIPVKNIATQQSVSFRKIYHPNLAVNDQIAHVTARLTIMRRFDQLFHRDIQISILSLLTFFIFFAQVGVLMIFLNRLPPYLPLFYSLPWGEGQLIPLHLFVVVPLIIPILFIIHTILGARLYPNNPVIVRLLFLSLCTVALLLGITQIKIMTQVMG